MSQQTETKTKMKVSHKQFGTGTVISQDANNVTVDFNGTVKTLITKFSRLTNEDGSEFGITFVAPVKKTKKLNPANFGAKSNYDNWTSDQKYAFDQKLARNAYNSKSW